MFLSKIFESWRKKLPAISGPVNLYIPTRFKDKYLEVESYFVDKSIWNVHITFHDDKRFCVFLPINLLLNLVRRNLWIIVSNI